MKKEKTITSFKWLSEGLQEAAQQLARGDASILGETLGLVSHTVRPYLKGEVADFNTGSMILTEARKLIKQREQRVKKLVA